MPPVDMSPEAVDLRLKQVSDLRDVCIALAGPRLRKPWGVDRPAVPEAAQPESAPPVKTSPPSAANAADAGGEAARR